MPIETTAPPAPTESEQDRPDPADALETLTTFRISERDHARIRAIMRILGVSRSELIRTGMRKELERLEIEIRALRERHAGEREAAGGGT